MDVCSLENNDSKSESLSSSYSSETYSIPCEQLLQSQRQKLILKKTNSIKNFQRCVTRLELIESRNSAPQTVSLSPRSPKGLLSLLYSEQFSDSQPLLQPHSEISLNQQTQFSDVLSSSLNSSKETSDSISDSQGILPPIGYSFENVFRYPDGGLDIDTFVQAALDTVKVFELFEGGPGSMFGELARRDCESNVEKIMKASNLLGTKNLMELVKLETMKTEKEFKIEGSGTEGFLWLVRNLQFELQLIILLYKDLCSIDENIRSISQLALDAFRYTLGKFYAWWMRMMFENGIRFAPSRQKFLMKLVGSQGMNEARAGFPMKKAISVILSVLTPAANFLNAIEKIDARLPRIELEE